jgi:glycosyltransferase involved in cell wall biosynthesis
MKQNKFSVIIPVYNSQKYLNECLNSVINQTYRNLEIILVNDGSKDNSLNIIQKFAKEDGRIIIANQKNTGVSAARNLGLAMASGTYVMFIDSDDYLIDDKAIEKICVAVEKNCDVIMFNILYENKTTTYPLLEKSYKDKRELDNFIFRMVKDEHINSPCNKVYSRKILNEHNIQFDNNVKIGEDLLFNIGYFKHCKSVYYLNNTLYFYRTSNTGSATSAYLNNKYSDLMMVNDAMYAWLHDRDDDKLVGISQFVRIKNILSCLRDINHPASTLGVKDKREIILLYKVDNAQIIIRNCGLKIFIVSHIYSFVNIILLSRLINNFWSKAK